MDPNVTGRYGIYGMPHGIPGRAPRIAAIVALALTPESHGNAFGIGMVDVVPVDVASAIDWPTMYMNAFTSGRGGFIRPKLPLVVRDRRAAVRTALAMVGAGDPERALVARVHDTGHVGRLWLSPALLARSSGVRELPLDPSDPDGLAFLDED
jgi:hypothetical protein